MFIKDFTYYKNNNTKAFNFDNINQLIYHDLLLLSSTISVYYNILGASKENKDISKYIPEDSQCDINVELGEKNFHWIRKYNASRNTYSVLKFSEIKKFADEQSKNRMNNLDNKYLPFYYIVKSNFNYEDGDYFTRSYVRSMEGVYSNQEGIFLHEFVNFDMISKQDKDKNEFSEAFNIFLNHFSISSIKYKKLQYDYIDELSNVSYFGKSHLHLRFYAIDEKDNKIYFSDMSEEDSTFIILLGEIYYRLYMIRLFTKQLDVTIKDIKGILISYLDINYENVVQIQKQLPNLQFFIKKTD